MQRLFICKKKTYSHSIVPGGFDVTSYTTRLIPRTSLTILLEIVLNTSNGSVAQSAVMPSSVSPARTAQVFAYVLWSPITPTDLTGSSTAKLCHTFRYKPAFLISSTTI